MDPNKIKDIFQEEAKSILENYETISKEQLNIYEVSQLGNQ